MIQLLIIMSAIQLLMQWHIYIYIYILGLGMDSASGEEQGSRPPLSRGLSGGGGDQEVADSPPCLHETDAHSPLFP